MFAIYTQRQCDGVCLCVYMLGWERNVDVASERILGVSIHLP